MAVFDIKLGARRFSLRPKLQAYRNIEARLGFNMAEVFKLALAGHLKLEEATIIVFEGIGDGVDQAAVELCLFDDRYAENPEVMRPILRFLIALLYKPELREKKFEAEVQPVLESLTTI